MAFIAPKVIGGARAPTPVGELGFVEMTQAVDVCDYQWRQVGPDLMMVGYLPASGGLAALAAELDDGPAQCGAGAGGVAGNVGAGVAGNVGVSSQSSVSSSATQGSSSSAAAAATAAAASSQSLGTAGAANAASSVAAAAAAGAGAAGTSGQQQHPHQHGGSIPFYKAWDTWGALSNFSPHPITLPHYHAAEAAAGTGNAAASEPHVAPTGTIPAPDRTSLAATQREPREWKSVEHYYQAQKFAGSGAAGAAAVVESIASAESPEEAARIGRGTERARPDLMTPGWPSIKVAAMAVAVRAKFAAHAGPRETLVATGNRRLAEASPNDYFWGAGYNGRGRNTLGLILEGIRAELLAGQGGGEGEQ